MMLQRRLVGLVRLAPVPAALAVLASLAAIGCAVGMAVAVAEVLRRLLSGDGLATITGSVTWALVAAVERAALLWVRDLAADRVVVLDCGRIVGDGSHADLLTGCPEYARLVDAQWSLDLRRGL